MAEGLKAIRNLQLASAAASAGSDAWWLLLGLFSKSHQSELAYGLVEQLAPVEATYLTKSTVS